MDIPSKYNPIAVEPRILDTWLSGNTFHAQANSSKTPYTIVIPPPNVTGILHMGHALNNTIQDVLMRYYRLKGREGLWMPGMDHAGIATQNVVEKQLAKEGSSKEDIGRTEFEKRLWSWKGKYGSTIINQLKRLGASCDWQRTRFTMDDDYSEAVKEVFIKLYNEGLVYRGNYIINWCPRCKTALSDEEAGRKEIDGWLYYIRYPVKQKSDVRNQKSEEKYVVVATTRPETMLGDTAVAINPHDERYSWLKSEKVVLPVVERELKVIEDDAIDPSFGTGVVKVTPAHDPVDFMLGKKHNLEFVNIMRDDARLNENVPDQFIDMDRFEAREALVSLLKEKDLIEKKEPHTISAGHCYRCNTVIEPRVSLQWFVKMKPLAKAAIEVVENDSVRFYPERWKKVYLNWMYNIQDWCISRQIWWGHRMPVYYCKKCVGTAAEKDKKEESCEGVIVSNEKPHACPKCGSASLAQDEDVLDTWFSSWLWPFVTMGWPQKTKELSYFYPTDCLVTGSEILFFWVARMIMAGLKFTGEIPFRDVLIHGTVRDARGIKMSKSLGNIIDPIDVIGRFGADALRFSLMLSAASGSDVHLSDERFLVGRNFCNKIWNATRFILMKIDSDRIMFDDLTLSDCDAVDVWLLHELDTTVNEVSRHLEAYSLNEATKKIYDFFWHVFCDWYIEIAKDFISAARAKVLIVALLDSMKALSPIMPFISEEVLLLLKQCVPALHHEQSTFGIWPAKRLSARAQADLDGIQALIETVKSIRAIKIDLGLAQKKVGLEVCLRDNKDGVLWEHNRLWVKRLALVDDIKLTNKLDRVLDEQKRWAINLAIEINDMSAFRATLDKKVSSLASALEKVQRRLSSEGFRTNAEAAVIEREERKHHDMTAQYARLKKLQDAFTEVL